MNADRLYFATAAGPATPEFPMEIQANKLERQYIRLDHYNPN